MSKKSEETIQIRDSRRRQMYRIDDVYIDAYARICGVSATAVYNSICRHAGSDQESCPSIQRIGEQHGISNRSVMRAIAKLESFNIIQVIRRRNEKNKRKMVNIYVLVDQSLWHEPGDTTTLGSSTSQVTPRHSVPGDKSDTNPGDKIDKKPGDTTTMEGDTEEKEAQREGVVAQSATDSSNKNNPDRPMNLVQFVAWCHTSPHKHINLIGDWAETTEPEFNTVGQWTAYLKRNLRPAKELTPFTHDQLSSGFKRIKKAIHEGWLKTYTMETLFKFITNPNIEK